MDGINGDTVFMRLSVCAAVISSLGSSFYSVSRKNPPLRFSDIFSQTVGIIFYTPIIRSFLH